MQELTPETSTDAVLDQMATASDPRMKEVMAAAVRHSIPMDGPVGSMAQGRHGIRSAHIHFLVGAPGYRELVTTLYPRDDPHLADDVVIGPSDDLAVDIIPDDPDCPIPGVLSICFDPRLSREGEAVKTGGRVGSDPSAILKEKAAAAPAAS